jgi:excinuclease UvrABC helicase subunit UvrB
MKLTGILIVNSVLITLGLLSSGAYLIIDNLVEPSGNLFEGIVIFSLGMVMSMLLLLASTLGKVIQTFTDIYTQQVDIQQKVNDFYSKPKPMSMSIADIINDAKDSITITNLETGETTSQPLGNNINDTIASFLSNMMANIPNPSGDNLSSLSIEELEKELSNAVKSDDFERAQEVRDLIKNLRDNKKD